MGYKMPAGMPSDEIRAQRAHVEIRQLAGSVMQMSQASLQRMIKSEVDQQLRSLKEKLSLTEQRGDLWNSTARIEKVINSFDEMLRTTLPTIASLEEQMNSLTPLTVELVSNVEVLNTEVEHLKSSVTIVANEEKDLSTKIQEQTRLLVPLRSHQNNMNVRLVALDTELGNKLNEVDAELQQLKQWSRQECEVKRNTPGFRGTDPIGVHGVVFGLFQENTPQLKERWMER